VGEPRRDRGEHEEKEIDRGPEAHQAVDEDHGQEDQGTSQSQPGPNGPVDRGRVVARLRDRSRVPVEVGGVVADGVGVRGDDQAGPQHQRQQQDPDD